MPTMHSVKGLICCCNLTKLLLSRFCKQGFLPNQVAVINVLNKDFLTELLLSRFCKQGFLPNQVAVINVLNN